MAQDAPSTGSGQGGTIPVVEHVDGPVGVQARNFSKARIESLGWQAKVSLREGIARTYAWIEEEIRTSER